MGEPTTEAGKRLLGLLDRQSSGPPTESWRNGVAYAAECAILSIPLIEAEAYAMGHNDGKVPWPSRDAARAEARSAVLRGVRDEVEGMTRYAGGGCGVDGTWLCNWHAVLAAIDRRLDDA